MIAHACDGCGRISVESEEVVRVDSPGGHHAIPGDGAHDWICYGQPVPIKDPFDHDLAVKTFADRSVFGLEILQPSKTALIDRGTELETMRTGILVDIAASGAAELARLEESSELVADAVVKEER